MGVLLESARVALDSAPVFGPERHLDGVAVEPKVIVKDTAPGEDLFTLRKRPSTRVRIVRDMGQRAKHPGFPRK